MTDRIAELRALLDYEGSIDDTDVDALLDCAEALQDIMGDLEACSGLMPTQVSRGMAALARLNGDDNAG